MSIKTTKNDCQKAVVFYCTERLDGLSFRFRHFPEVVMLAFIMVIAIAFSNDGELEKGQTRSAENASALARINNELAKLSMDRVDITARFDATRKDDLRNDKLDEERRSRLRVVITRFECERIRLAADRSDLPPIFDPPSQEDLDWLSDPARRWVALQKYPEMVEWTKRYSKKQDEKKKLLGN